MKRLALAVVLVASAHAHLALAAAEIFIAQPSYDREAGELSVFVGATRADGSPAKPLALRLLVDGNEAGEALAVAPLASYENDNPKWEPPLAVGVVYFWATGGPPQILDGIEALFKHLPPRTRVYPTPYGQGHRPLITGITAARAAGGDLADTPPLEGTQYRLLEAIRYNTGKLAEDDSPIKYLVVVTDGRDYHAVSDSGLAAAVGEDLRKSGLRVALVAFPAKEDSLAAQSNLRALAASAHARTLTADRLSDLAPLVEAQSETILSLARVRFSVPWRARGAARAVAVAGMVDGTAVHSAEAHLDIPGGAGWIWIVVVVFVLGAAAGGVWFWRKRSAGPALSPIDDLLAEVDELVRLGIPAARAVEELSLAFPEDVSELAEIDPAALSPELRHLRTRAGQARLAEIQRLLTSRDEEPTLDEEMAEILAQGIAHNQTPAQTSERLQALVSGERWAALARASKADLQESLAAAGEDFAELADAAALGYALKVQSALREPDARGPAAAVAWLVRAAGPGQRGQTLRIVGEECRIGRGAGCKLRLSDDSVAEEHAAVLHQGSEFLLVPREGAVKVEGAPIQRAQLLADGETIEIGAGRFIFKCVT